MKKIVVLVLALLTTACGISLEYVPTTIRELLPVGASLRLTQPLVIPADHSYVYIVNGKVEPFRNYNSVNIYKPYCMFYLQKPALQERRVTPDRFMVTKVIEWEDFHGGLTHLKLASADIASTHVHGVIGGGLGMNDDGGPSTVMYATIISLHSDLQPEVKELICGHWETQGVVQPLTLAEMKLALGGLIVVE